MTDPRFYHPTPLDPQARTAYTAYATTYAPAERPLWSTTGDPAHSHG